MHPARERAFNGFSLMSHLVWGPREIARGLLAG
jgi:hypothetical protein